MRTRTLIALCCLIYLFSPIDFIPDFIIGLGQFDDLAVVAYSVWKLTRGDDNSGAPPLPPDRGVARVPEHVQRDGSVQR